MKSLEAKTFNIILKKKSLITILYLSSGQATKNKGYFISIALKSDNKMWLNLHHKIEVWSLRVQLIWNFPGGRGSGPSIMTTFSSGIFWEGWH